MFPARSGNPAVDGTGGPYKPNRKRNIKISDAPNKQKTLAIYSEGFDYSSNLFLIIYG